MTSPTANFSYGITGGDAVEVAGKLTAEVEGTCLQLQIALSTAGIAIMQPSGNINPVGDIAVNLD